MDEQTEEKKQPFRVTDIPSASWAAEKIREAQQAVARIKADAAERKQQAQDWEETMLKEWLNRIEHFSVLLRLWAENHMHEYTRNKSMALPCGMRMGFRQGSPKVSIEDEVALLEEIRQYHLDDAIKTEDKIVRGELKKHLLAGVQFENASLTPPVSAFYVQEKDE